MYTSKDGQTAVGGFTLIRIHYHASKECSPYTFSGQGLLVYSRSLMETYHSQTRRCFESVSALNFLYASAIFWDVNLGWI